MEGIRRRLTKIILRRKKDYNYRERLKKLGLTISTERRMRGDLAETLRIMEFLIMTDIFVIFLFDSQNTFQKQSQLTN